ncbi:MAG: aspartate aminotransferase family protein [Clostridium sp.]|nr:aspartate aminotransferase family protein [Clostridium sp.]MCM1547895.1 aspartate aminotransferase family protein [Ruminococcus sp.]
MNTTERFDKNVMQTYGRYGVVVERGTGRTCVDENGMEYIDFGSGIGVNSLGFCDEEWADAVCGQVRAVQHTSNYYYTKVQADFAGKLCDLTGYSKVFFGNSGAEANECAIKLARKYSFDKYGKGRHNIVTLVNSFHGRTLGTLAATGQDVFHNYFFPFPEGFAYAKANDKADLESKLDGACAVMLEFIQGEGGVVPLDYDFVDFVFDICEQKDILVIADEVQTGVGRTGKFLASENFDTARPDITTLAKGLAGGIPVGACLANEKCANVLTKGTHGSTFGGNPIACAGGNAVLDKVASEGFLEEVVKKGEYFKEKLEQLDEVESVTGMGLMIGIKLKTMTAADAAAKALENGLLVLTAKEKLRLLPPLNITYEEIDRGLDIIKNILKG